MKLQSLQPTPQSLLYLERRVNSRDYTKFSAYTEVSEAYQPWSKEKDFNLQFFKLPLADVSTEVNHTVPSEFSELYLKKDHVLFPVHPDTLQAIDARQRDYFLQHQSVSKKVEPTASSRTLLTTDPAPHFIKVHLPIRISRFLRTLRAVSVHTSVNMYQELCTWLPDNADYAVLPHLFGAWHNDFQWGFLGRSIDPFPYIDQPILIPFFSLYAKDENHPNDEPLLVQLIRYHQADPVEFTNTYLIQPTVKAWAQTVSELGIILEPHGQNTLLELDPITKLPRRIVIRDFQAPCYDPIIRKKRGLSLDLPSEYMLPDDKPHVRQWQFSNLYDYKIGHHVLSYFAKTIEDYFGASSKPLKLSAREVIRQQLGRYDLFPPTIHTYKQKQFKDNRQEIMDTKQQPVWR